MGTRTKKIAKNTIIMYLRMIVLMFIAFFTSRLLLSELGVEDFGVYSVVGSISSTFVALKSLFSESVQRFLNFEKGKNSLQGQIDVYSLSVYIHLILAVFFVIVVEIVGLWLLYNKLDIPACKLETAVFVFQMSVASTVFGILCIPFDAVLIANEKMGMFAIVTICDSVLKLLTVLLIPYLPFELLRSYSLLLVLIPFATLLFLILYCRKFAECKLVKVKNTNLARNLFSFSGWNFFGNIAFSLVHEGINLLLNIFGGLAYNASRTIAYQVRNVAVQLANNSIIAVRPKIMQQAAVIEENEILFSNINTISRLIFFIIAVPIAPLIVYCPELLEIWLKEVPDFSVLFTRLLLVGVLVRSLHEPLNMLHMAVGKIKMMMVLETIIMLFTLAIIYLLLSYGLDLSFAFAALAIMEIVIIIALCANAYYQFGFDVLSYFRQVCVKLLVFVTFIGTICFLFHSYILPATKVQCLMYSIILALLVCLSILFFLNKNERNIVKMIIKK